MNLPLIVKREYLTCHWYYKNENGETIALVTRYDNSQEKRKKWFHQYHIDKNGNWMEGAVTPSPLFGIDTLPKNHSDETVYIFEGEKCSQAAHNLGLASLTSMKGSNQSHLADWAILANYRYLKNIVLIPDNDAPGKKYIGFVNNEIKKACPNTKIWVLTLPNEEQGSDFVDWIQSSPHCVYGWNGFDHIDGPNSQYLKQAFETYKNKHQISADIYFAGLQDIMPDFEDLPEPIQESLPLALPCPINTLPYEIRRWIECLANQAQILPDYIAASLFVQLGSVIGRKRALRIRAGTKWIEFPNLWGILVGVSSSMKSVAMDYTVEPLNVLAEKARAAYQEALRKFESEQESWKVKKKIDLHAYEEAYKNQRTSTQFQSGNSPEKPKEKRYKSNDTTIEKLGILLSDNPQGILVYRDELSGLFNSFRKNGRENDRQFYLEGWSGKQSFDSDRMGRDIPHIKALCISILGTIQPGLIEPYVHGAIKGKMADDGFIQRFQIMVWPDMKSNWEISIDTNADAWESYIHQIFNVLDEFDFHNGQPVILSFSPEAQLIFDDWQKMLEMSLRKGNLAPHIEAHFTKYKKLLPALCLILEHVEAALYNQSHSEITPECLNKALVWLKYFESHAYRVYGSSANAVPQAAMSLINHIQNDEIKIPFTIRDIYHGRHWSGLSNAEEVKEALDFLIEKNYVKETRIQTGGRTTVKYWIHPRILEQDQG